METKLPRVNTQLITAEDQFVSKQNSHLAAMEKSPKTDANLRSIVPDTEREGPPILALLSDFQEDIMSLYQGESVELFSQLLPMCSYCGLVPIGPTDCTACKKEIVCSVCRDEKGINTCQSCWDQSAADITTPQENLTVSKLLSKAVFKCPYNCG